MTAPALRRDLDAVHRLVLEGLKGYKAKVYLFGSQTTGTARSKSDIDVAILPLERIPRWVFAEIREALEESSILYSVDLVDLSETDASFRRRVMREGVLWKG